MKNDEQEMPPAIREYRMAFEEYFSKQPKHKNKKESTRQMEEFQQWYNNERKQSDTGKTPAQMWEEEYGEKPPMKKIGVRGKR